METMEELNVYKAEQIDLLPYEEGKIHTKNYWTFDVPSISNSLLKPLHSFQAKTIAAVKASLFSGHKRIMVKSPTGSGKTEIASHIIHGAIEKGKLVIFAVNAITLVDQTARRFFNAGITRIGIMQANHHMTDPSQPVQICSVQTLIRRQIPPADLVIIDEAHFFFEFYKTWMTDWADVPFIGLSATPYTKGLGKYYDDLIISATTQELITLGFLCPFRVYAPSHPDLSEVQVVNTQYGKDYQTDQLSQVMNKDALVGNVVDTWLKNAEGLPTFCYGVDRAHAQHIQRNFLDAGVSCGYMDMNTNVEERNRQFAQLKAGELKIISNVGVLMTGVDQDIRCISLVRPTKSPTLFQQIIGRGLRTAPGKDFVKILDHSDTHLRLGFVTGAGEQYTELDDGKKGILGSRKKKTPLLPKECKNCGALRAPGKKCQACGFLPVAQSLIEMRDGELREIDYDKREKKKLNKDAPNEVKAWFFGELKTYAMQKGYKSGWAAMKYKEKYGCWPNAHRDAPAQDVSESTEQWIRSR